MATTRCLCRCRLFIHRRTVQRSRLRRSLQAPGRYIEALALIALVTALFVGGVSGLFRINYALTIGVVDFFGEFIPYVGPFVVALLGAFFAAVTGPGKLLAWIIIFGVIEFTTSQILAPRLISEKTGLNPAFIILLLLAGGTLGGVLWAAARSPCCGFCP